MLHKPRAVFLDHITVGPDITLQALEKVADVRYFDCSGYLETFERVRDCEVIIVNKTRLDADVIAAAKHARLIVVFATGTDNVDLEAARRAGIAVSNARVYCNAAVAQHVFALILALVQHVHRYHDLVASGAWSRSKCFTLFDYPIVELSGRTLGIVGFGSLGSSVAGIAESFGMRVLVAGRPGAADTAVGRTPYKQVLQDADVLSLHCPLTPDTHHLLDADAFALMKSEAIVINTARGGLIDSEALIAALRDGQIAGAGVDVLSAEPPAADDPLLSAHLPNLIVTPHIAWAARESRQRAINQLAENIASFYSGESLRRVV